MFCCTDGDYVVQFAIWQRGDIGLKLLSEELKNAVRCALCDLLIEFYLLPSSLSAVPTKFLTPFLPHKRQRSVSDPGEYDARVTRYILFDFIVVV